MRKRPCHYFQGLLGIEIKLSFPLAILKYINQTLIDLSEMEVNVFLERQNKKEKVKLEKEITVVELMEKLDVNKAEVVPVRNNELVTEDSIVKAGDEIKFLAVISGG